METLKKRINGLQTTYSEMVEGIKNLENDIISCEEFEVLLKKRIESAKGEADMCRQEIKMRKDVIKNLPILMAEVTKEIEKIFMEKTKISYMAGDFTEDDAILYDDWDERIV
jgi:chromosome segregation ATPase